MSKKIAINGFGRIGRLTARILLSKFPEVEIVAINDLTSPENLAYLFKYDTTFGRFSEKVIAGDGFLQIGKKKIKVLSQKNPAELPWKELEIDTVIEATGLFRTTEKAGWHIEAGAKKVVISAPAKSEEIPTIVLGANSPKADSQILSNASCTTNCITPALKVVLNNFGIKQSFGITVHAYTATQALQDGPTKKAFRDGRAAAQNSIPSSTGAAIATTQVLPELTGKLSLSALRVPVVTGSMVYLTIQPEKMPTSVSEINITFKTAAENDLKGVLEYTEDQIVSSDIVGNPHSSIFDAGLTEILGNEFKIVVWYDNEWGYSNRLAELVYQV